MRVLMYVLKGIGPLFIIVGIFCLPAAVDMGSFPFIVGGVFAIGGIVLGFTGWAEDVAPRMFWIKSRVELLDNQIGYALTLGFQFFCLGMAIATMLALWL